MSLNLKVFTNIHFKKMLAQPYWHVNCFLQSSCVTIFSTSSASTWTLQILNKLFFLAISDLTKGQTCTIDYFSSECPTDKQSTLWLFFFLLENTQHYSVISSIWKTSCINNSFIYVKGSFVFFAENMMLFYSWIFSLS